MDFRSEISRLVKGQVLKDEPLSRHTSFGIGGPADFFIQPATVDDLVAALRLSHVHGLPLMIIGRGTNLLVADAGVRGVVLNLSEACHQLLERSHGLIVGSGVPVAELLDFCVLRGWSGVEFMAGIPGSVGGAVRVNAGAWDESIGQRVRTIKGYDFTGKPISLKARDMRFSYRRAQLPGDLVIADIDLALTKAPSQTIQAKVKEFLRRRSTQPTGQRSAGCVFKNPPQAAAGKLIEESGCKGLRVGGAEVSPEHANFIINRGGATAADVSALIQRVREKVKDRFGIKLETEILWVGED
jgi:UDP-N-acetylmuramate dehydrogenase